MQLCYNIGSGWEKDHHPENFVTPGHKNLLLNDLRIANMTANTNCLEGMRCPECGSLEPFLISARVTVVAYDDGVAPDGDIEWEGDSGCLCKECGHSGIVSDFN